MRETLKRKRYLGALLMALAAALGLSLSACGGGGGGTTTGGTTSTTTTTGSTLTGSGK